MKKPAKTPYLETLVNFGGDIVTRGEAIRAMRVDGISDERIDYWMMGARTITTA